MFENMSDLYTLIVIMERKNVKEEIHNEEIRSIASSS